jgi:hypothetical protein
MKKLADLKAEVDLLGGLASKSAELAEFVGLSDVDTSFEAEVSEEIAKHNKWRSA